MTDKAAPGKKGLNMTMPEDVEMAKAFVATSEDNTVGSNQKSSDFKAKMLVNYNGLITKYNRIYSQQYVLRSNQNSLFSRFKGHSRMVLKMIGIEETNGDIPSGDTGRAKWIQMIKDTWVKRNPEDARLVETIYAMKMVLSKHPKWRKFQTDENTLEEQKKKKREAKARPEGSKRAKQAHEDKKIIESLVSSASVASNGAKEDGVTKVANSLDFLSKALVEQIQAQNNHLKSQNDLRIMEGLSPKSKEAMSKQMALVRMREMQHELSKFNTTQGLDINATDIDVASNLTSEETITRND